MREDALAPLLFYSISRELQDMLLHNPGPSRTYREFGSHLQTLDNRLQKYQHHIARSCNSASAGTSARAPAQPAPVRPHETSRPFSAQTPSPRKEPVELSMQRQSDGRKERHDCYCCGPSSHFIVQCAQPNTRKVGHNSFCQARSPTCTASPSAFSTGNCSFFSASLNDTSLA